MLIQVLANGIIAGAIYALVASGFSLVYSTARFVHFAHGATVAAGAYFLYFLSMQLGASFWPSAVVAVAFAAAVGIAMNAFVYKPLRCRNASSLVLLMAGFAMLVLVEAALLIAFGADIKTFNAIRVEKGMEIAGAVITPLQVSIIATAAALLLGLHLFMKRTRLGKTMRAVACNKTLAEARGIDVEKTHTYAFAVSSAIAGVAGVLIGLEQGLEPTMGANLVIKSFTGTVIGGIGSVPGAVLGSLLVGMAENVGAWFLPSGYKDAVAFVLLFAFLLFKPDGLLGINRGVNK